MWYACWKDLINTTDKDIGDLVTHQRLVLVVDTYLPTTDKALGDLVICPRLVLVVDTYLPTFRSTSIIVVVLILYANYFGQT